MEWIKVSVACLLVCVFKCSAMSLNEIEDFSNFLIKTSQLDQILKKGADPDEDFDEDDLVSDHAWEESGKFEGDLVLNERQRRMIVEEVAEGLSRNGLKDSTKRWPNNEVTYYIQREHFSGDQVQAIQDGIDDLAQASCVKFKPYRKGDRDAVVIQILLQIGEHGSAPVKSSAKQTLPYHPLLEPFHRIFRPLFENLWIRPERRNFRHPGSRRGCFSQVGYQGGYQVLNLSGRHPVGRGCFRHGTVVHELLHTLGFFHMQSSPDRDDYIDVLFENIIERARHNFRKYNAFAVSDFGVGYDYDSVLHYSRRAFSANGRDTLVPKQNGASIGQRVGLSDKDTQKLNKMYCDADSDNNEADEETTHTSNSKKTPKNKPFEGHGIGYHQGKTVVIKLPAAETYKLPDLPTFHVFDYFSKAPKTVSPALVEGFGIRKEVGHSYQRTPPAMKTEEYEMPVILPDIDRDNGNTDIKPDTNDSHNSQEIYLTKPSVNENVEGKSQNFENSKDSSLEVKAIESPDTPSDDLNEAFERLGKIIKTHVYPSQIQNFSIYKQEIDYSKLYNPEKKYDSEPEIIKVDDDFHPSSLPLGGKEPENENYYDVKFSNQKLPQQFIKSLYDRESSVPDEHYSRIQETDKKKKNPSTDFASSLPTNDKKASKEAGSFAISYSEIPEVKDEEYVNPEYATLERLLHKNNFSNFDNSDSEENSDPPKGKHTVFSYVVPFNAEWYEKDVHIPNKQQTKKYNHDEIIYQYPSQEKSRNKQVYQHYPVEDKLSVSGAFSPSKQAYSIYGVLVPLTQNWYKV